MDRLALLEVRTITDWKGRPYQTVKLQDNFTDIAKAMSSRIRQIWTDDLVNDRMEELQDEGADPAIIDQTCDSLKRWVEGLTEAQLRQRWENRSRWEMQLEGTTRRELVYSDEGQHTSIIFHCFNDYVRWPCHGEYVAAK